jgi:hypothetical protein
LQYYADTQVEYVQFTLNHYRQSLWALCAGLVLSVVAFIGELIVHHIRDAACIQLAARTINYDGDD